MLSRTLNNLLRLSWKITPVKNSIFRYKNTTFSTIAFLFQIAILSFLLTEICGVLNAWKCTMLSRRDHIFCFQMMVCILASCKQICHELQSNISLRIINANFYTVNWIFFYVNLILVQIMFLIRRKLMWVVVWNSTCHSAENMIRHYTIEVEKWLIFYFDNLHYWLENVSAQCAS